LIVVLYMLFPSAVHYPTAWAIAWKIRAPAEDLLKRIKKDKQ